MLICIGDGKRDSLWIETRTGQIGLFCAPTGENLLPSWAANFSQLGRIYESFHKYLTLFCPVARILYRTGKADVWIPAVRSLLSRMAES